MEHNYERDYSHSHCWNQGGAPACGIPLEKHTQCCLCDTPFPKQPPAPEKCQHEENDYGGCSKCGEVLVNGETLPDIDFPAPEKEWEGDFDDLFWMKNYALYSGKHDIPATNAEIKSFIASILEEKAVEVEGLKWKYSDTDTLETESTTDGRNAALTEAAAILRR